MKNNTYKAGIYNRATKEYLGAVHIDEKNNISSFDENHQKDETNHTVGLLSSFVHNHKCKTKDLQSSFPELLKKSLSSGSKDYNILHIEVE